MSEFEQYQLNQGGLGNNNSTARNSLDPNSSPNVFRLDKDLNVKNQFTVNNIEAHNKLGSKINGRTTNASYQIQLTDFLIAVTDVATVRTITLPKPTVAGPFKVFIIKDASGSAATTTITVSPNGTELINGDTTTTISTNYGSIGVYTDGVNWFIV